MRPSPRNIGAAVTNVFLASGMLLLAGCRGERTQSALHPAGPAAERIAELWWVMFGLGTAVFVVVMVMFYLAVARGRSSDRPPLGSTGLIVVAGLAVPLVILVYVLYHSVAVQLAIRVPESDLTIQVIGHQWWWEVRYPDHGVVTANEIWIPTGEPVRLEIWTNDVIHSFWVPQLHGKMDLLPEKVNTFWIQADVPGVYRGQCAEFCGLQHANMGKLVIAGDPEEFEEWLVNQAREAVQPVEPRHVRGLEVFVQFGCANCHAVRGTISEQVEVGPDLTHIASRRTLAAAMRPNSIGNLSGWITDPQSFKPGNLMPATHLPPEDLDALVAYLMSLE